MKRMGLLILVLMVFVGISCQKQLNSPLSAPNDLLNKEWRLTDWSASSLHPADFMITANFDKDTIFGKSAVNQYNGPYTLSSNSGISMGMLAMTMMAGSEDEMRAEQIFHELLTQVVEYEINPSSLRLLDKNNNELLIFAYLHK